MALLRIRNVLYIVMAVYVSACSQQPQYISDSRQYTSFGIDSHDIDDMIDKTAKNLLESNFVKNLKEQKAIMITDIINQTDDEIDTEIIRNELLLRLVDNEKFIIINAINDAHYNKTLQATRNLRENEEYNQYTTIEKGNLISPHYYLTGKITQHKKIINDKEIKEYLFVFTLTDLKIGAMRWINTERLSKIAPKSKNTIAESSDDINTIEQNAESSLMQDTINVDDISLDSTQDDFAPLDSTISLDEGDSAIQSNESDFFSSDRKNHFLMGIDLGIMNLSKIDFTPLRTTIDSKYYHISMSPSATNYTFPLNVRLGYLRDFDDKWALGINFLYNYTLTSLDSSDLNINTSSSYLSQANIKASITAQKLGGEVLVYYKSYSDVFKDLHFYVGAGVYGDVGSKVKINLDTNIQSTQLTRKINAIYPIIKLGAVWYFTNLVGLSYEINYSWAIGDSFVSTGFGWGVFGLQLKI